MAYFWTDAEISFVATNYNIMTVRSICEKINRPESSVRMLACKLGVTRSTWCNPAKACSRRSAATHI